MRSGSGKPGWGCLWPMVAMLLWAAPAAAEYARLVVFGDSLSDTGNVYHQTFGISPQSPPNYDGRFSNGPVWVEEAAWRLDLSSPLRSRSGGYNYAYGGARTGSGSVVYFPFSFPNIGTQIDSYLSLRAPAAGDLFMVWGGGNDFMDGQTNPAVPANNLANHITTLASAGAVSFVVSNLPPLGQIPRYRGTASESVMDSRSRQFNALLASHVDSLRDSLGISIFHLDVEFLFDEMLAAPWFYGLSNVTSPALVGGNVVPNPDDYLFWDEVHPTRVGHQLLGRMTVELLHTRRWTASETIASWSNPTSWDAAAVPTADWVAVLENRSATPRTAVVPGDSAVQVVRVRGHEAEMGLRIDAGATLTAEEAFAHTGGVIELNGGTLAARTEILGGRVTGRGVITGDLHNLGTFAPQDVTVVGDYQQHEQGELLIELSAEHLAQPPLVVNGQASLSGILAITAADEFIPLPGQSFSIMAYPGRAGELDIDNRTGLAGLSFIPSYGAQELSLSTWAIGGDANLDGIVDIADLSILASNWQQAGNWLAGDFTGDKFVNIADLSVLASNWQANVAGTELGEAMAMFEVFNGVVIPEPSMPLIMMGTMTVIISRRWRRGRRRLLPVPSR